MKYQRSLFVWFKRYKGIIDGGGQANLRNFSLAKQILGEENIDSVYIHDENKKRSLWSYACAAFHMLHSYHNGITPLKVSEIVASAASCDCVFLSSSVFGIIAKKLKESGYKGTIITHFHNVEEMYYDALVPKYIPFRQIIVNCAKNNDKWACLYSDKVLTLNKRDSDLLKQKYGRGADFFTPISLPDRCQDALPDRQTLTKRKPLCTFIGSCFKANNDGVLWFVKNVLPHVDVEFRIVGKGMANLKARHSELSNIEVISDAPDLSPFFMDADFMVLPVFTGGGMKVKTCESLMYGKNILGTTETFEGYSVDTDKVGKLCNTADEYIAAIRHYCEHPVPRFNGYSRNVYLEKYSDNAILNNFKAVFDIQEK